MNYTKFDRVSLVRHPSFTERWVQDRIAEDPAILGLGDVIVRDKERTQPRAGRLDLLLQEADGNRRYEVEIQLGPTDESHIIRTIEYWDIERKRYPQYDHSAVIVAEDITSRFLNIISLFNGHIPLIALQMQALVSGPNIGLVFTKILDQVSLGLVDEDEDTHEATDRRYWEDRASPQMLAVVDELLQMIRALNPALELKYNKFYIGLASGGNPSNFVIFRPKKGFIRVEPHLPNAEETRADLEKSGLDVMDYDERWERCRIRLTADDVRKNKPFLEKLFRRAFDYSAR